MALRTLQKLLALAGAACLVVSVLIAAPPHTATATHPGASGRLAFACGMPATDIYTVDVDGANLTRLTNPAR